MSGPWTLEESQVLRYSRSILLSGVGGRGQASLLGTGARLTAGGPALLTAAAYLAAGGTPVEAPPGMLHAGDAGFLVRAGELGMPAKDTLARALERLNPDAVSTPLRFGTVAALPGAVDGPRPLVAVGVQKGQGVVWGATAEACPVCLADVVRGAEAPPNGAEAIQAGTVAALLFQRAVLGLARPLSGLRLLPDGGLEALAAPACGHAREVPASVLAELVRHLEACYPEEGCGVVLYGPAGARWVPLANAYRAWAGRDPAAFPRTARSAFVFEPSEWLALLKEADSRGEQVASIVHAHPDGPAAFSAEDRLQAAPGGLPLFPKVTYWVVAVREGRAVEATEARWEEGGFQEKLLPLPSSRFG